MTFNIGRYGLPAIGAHVAALGAEPPIAIEEIIECGGVAGVDAWGIERIAAGCRHQMEIAVLGIAEEGIDTDIALAGPERVLDVAKGNLWKRRANFVINIYFPVMVCAISPKYGVRYDWIRISDA